MQSIPLPTKLKFEQTDNPFRKKMILEPCYAGYGITIGNVLRRVLLSSLPGGAVTGIKIKGVTHEFTTLENVKEDVVDIILNFKKLRLKIFTDDEVRLTLKVKGAKDVLAGDINKDSNVEIVNKDLKLFTITDPQKEVEMEIFVKKGRGYEPTEVRDNKNKEVGLISIDSLFSPIRNVGYQIENVRVGKMTNFEKLIVDIETDGSIEPEEAVYQARQIIMDHLQLISPDFLKKQDKNEEESLNQQDKEEEVSEK